MEARKKLDLRAQHLVRKVLIGPWDSTLFFGGYANSGSEGAEVGKWLQKIYQTLPSTLTAQIPLNIHHLLFNGSVEDIQRFFLTTLSNEAYEQLYSSFPEGEARAAIQILFRGASRPLPKGLTGALSEEAAKDISEVLSQGILQEIAHSLPEDSQARRVLECVSLGIPQAAHFDR